MSRTSWRVFDSPTLINIAYVVSSMSFAALLIHNENELRRVAESARIEHRRAPGSAIWTDSAIHRLELLEGGPSEVSEDLRGAGNRMLLTVGTLWLDCKEAIDAGYGAVAIEGVRALTRDVPHGRAVRAAVEGAVTGEENRWQDVLGLAVNHQLRLIAVDALEGLGVAAARRGKLVGGTSTCGERRPTPR